MTIVIRLDRILFEKKMTLVELSKKVGVTPVNLSKLKTGKVSGVRFSTLDAICEALGCQPGDIIQYSSEAPCLEPSASEEGYEGPSPNAPGTVATKDAPPMPHTSLVRSSQDAITL